MQKNILLAGGTGLIGKRLQTLLKEKGYNVLLLSRRPDPTNNIFGWDPEQGVIDDNAVKQADVIINLAGTGIADGRWTAARKKSIINSRVQGAQVIREAIERTGHRPKAYLSASAIGYYGDSGEKAVVESDPPGPDGFKTQTCILWEKAAQSIADLGIRTAVFRIGVVLAKEGGALKEIIKPLNFGLGTYFADGQAWYSWIHLEDICRIFVWAIEHAEIEGTFNAVAPHPVRNIDLTKATAHALGKPAIFVPAPAFAMRLMLGEMADVVLDSSKVSAEKIEKAGFIFLYPTLPTALSHL